MEESLNKYSKWKWIFAFDIQYIFSILFINTKEVPVTNVFLHKDLHIKHAYLNQNNMVQISFPVSSRWRGASSITLNIYKHTLHFCLF